MTIISTVWFMLPTQASNAIVIDGSILIILAAMVMAYILYKNRSDIFDTSLLPRIEYDSNDNINVEKSMTEIKGDNSITFNTKDKSKSHQNDFRIPEDNEYEEEYLENKEVVYNNR